MLSKRIKTRWRHFSNKRFAKIRRSKLNNTDFTIISNNCWGGFVYNRYGIPYKTPTVGLYFYAEEYIKLVKNIKYYLNCDLKFISYSESKYSKDLLAKEQTNVPIGLLDDIEIVFLHYKNEKEAYSKWNRRLKRINWNNLIFKFSQDNKCNEEHLTSFDNLPYKKKVLFVNKPNTNLSSAIYFKGFEDKDSVTDDTTDYAKYIDITRLINKDIKI
jgi:uncharacterized protein (DUF1919 family)